MIRYVTTSGHSGKYKTWRNFEGDTVENLLKEIFVTEVMIWDADTCGSFHHYVRMNINGKEKFYDIEYSWYLQYDPEWELIDSYEINEVSYENIPENKRERLISDRNWLFV